jgi:hypothetical protein
MIVLVSFFVLFFSFSLSVLVSCQFFEDVKGSLRKITTWETSTGEFEELPDESIPCSSSKTVIFFLKWVGL